MFKNIIKLILIVFAVFLCASCGTVYKKQQAEFSNVFNTNVSLIGYTASEDEFSRYAGVFFNRLEKLDRLFSMDVEYPGENNIWTVNQKAGSEPVYVDGDIISLLLNAQKAYSESGGALNVANGAVSSIWRDYLKQADKDSEKTDYPPDELLRSANEHTDINKLIINEEEGSVFLAEQGMSLDIGSFAAGFAAKLAADELKEMGFNSFVISVGNNTVSSGRPLKGKHDFWGVNIKTPSAGQGGRLIDTVNTNDALVITTGVFEGYAAADKPYCDIIDIETLKPVEKYLSVTVISDDMLDNVFLSSALFMLPIDKGKELAEKYGAGVLWVLKDGNAVINEAYNMYSKTFTEAAGSATNSEP